MSRSTTPPALSGLACAATGTDRYCTTRGYDYVQNANYPAEAAVNGFAGFSRQVVVAERSVDLVSPGTGYKVATVRAESLPVSNVDLGIEIRRGERELVSGASGQLDRVEFAAKYSF